MRYPVKPAGGAFKYFKGVLPSQLTQRLPQGGMRACVAPGQLTNRPVGAVHAAAWPEMLQRGLHAEELGDLVVARDCYREVIALGDSKAAAIARQHLARLG